MNLQWLINVAVFYHLIIPVLKIKFTIPKLLNENARIISTSLQCHYLECWFLYLPLMRILRKTKGCVWKTTHACNQFRLPRHGATEREFIIGCLTSAKLQNQNAFIRDIRVGKPLGRKSSGGKGSDLSEPGEKVASREVLLRPCWFPRHWLTTLLRHPQHAPSNIPFRLSEGAALSRSSPPCCWEQHDAG